MAWCLAAPSHYLNQCSLITSEVLWYSPEGNSPATAGATIVYNEFDNQIFWIMATSTVANGLMYDSLSLWCPGQRRRGNGLYIVNKSYKRDKGNLYMKRKSYQHENVGMVMQLTYLEKQHKHRQTNIICSACWYKITKLQTWFTNATSWNIFFCNLDDISLKYAQLTISQY